MEKGDKKNNLKNDQSNKNDVKPNPQNKPEYTKRNWNDYLEQEQHEELKNEINIKKKKTSQNKIEYI